MGSKNKPGEFDCYANAEPDEPMFVLLARDKHAPAIVWLWAVLRELDGEKPEKVAEARGCVLEMMVWGKDRGKQHVGLGQAALAGVMELVRAANQASKDAKNAPTDDEFVRLILSKTAFEPASGNG